MTKSYLVLLAFHFDSTGCPKNSFLYFISTMYFSTIGLGKQIRHLNESCVSIFTNYFHTCCAICLIEYSICVLPRQRCAWANIFSSHIFFDVFYSPNCLNFFLVFRWISQKINPLNEKRSAMWKYKHVCFRFTGLSVVETVKKLEKPNVGW